MSEANPNASHRTIMRRNIGVRKRTPSYAGWRVCAGEAKDKTRPDSRPARAGPGDRRPVFNALRGSLSVHVLLWITRNSRGFSKM
jgi:hypothetical protein